MKSFMGMILLSEGGVPYQIPCSLTTTFYHCFRFCGVGNALLFSVSQAPGPVPFHVKDRIQEKTVCRPNVASSELASWRAYEYSAYGERYCYLWANLAYGTHDVDREVPLLSGGSRYIRRNLG